MSYSKGLSAIQHPTFGPRGVPPGLAVGVPRSGITSGVSGLTNAPVGGFAVNVKNTNLTDFNTGFVANRCINTVLSVEVESAEADDFYPEELVLAEAEGQKHLVGVYQTKRLRSISKWNRYLRSEAGRRKYGHIQDGNEAFKDIHFVGQAVVGSSAWQRNSTHERAITITQVGRVRMPDFTRAQKNSTKNRRIFATANTGDYLFLVALRCKAEDDVANMLEPVEAEVTENAQLDSEEIDRIEKHKAEAVRSMQLPPPYYWQFFFVTRADRQPPPYHCYCNDEPGEDFFIGKIWKLGMIGEVSGDRNFDMHLREAALRAIAGEADYRDSINQLGFIEVWFGTH